MWISPVVKQADGVICEEGGCREGYHGYWQQDLYSIDAHFGTAAELKTLVNALHARELCVMT